MIKRIVLSALMCLPFLLPHQYINSQTSSYEDYSEYDSVVLPQRIAYINSIDLLESVPGKKEASEAISELNRKYKEELVIMQNDYNKKYSDFITYQGSMSESIKVRRMQELYELERSINHFIRVAQEDIESQEQHFIKPLQEKLQQAIQEVGEEQNYVCIYDLANPAISFVTPAAIDANPVVLRKLRELQ